MKRERARKSGKEKDHATEYKRRKTRQRRTHGRVMYNVEEKFDLY